MTQPAWGNPWRGLLQGGQIQLPNGSTKAAPQPTFINTRHWDEQGATFLQRGPLAGVTRSSEELAADAAAGRTWRDDAILSGQRMSLYGKTLNGWVYCAPDGLRWRVRTTTLMVPITTSMPLNLNVTLHKFGEFGGTDVSQVVNLALADLQQTDPSPSYPSGTAANLMVCDITQDGSRALLMIYQPVVPFSPPSTNWHPLHKRPLGWLEVAFTSEDGIVSASVTVVRSRSQTLGTSALSDPINTQADGYIQTDTLVRVDMGTYYEDTYTPRPLAASGSLSNRWVWMENAGTYERSISGRVLALWYKEDGGLEEVTIDVSSSGPVSNPPPTETVSGSLVQRVQKSNGAVTVISDDRAHSLARTCSATENFSYVLKRGGAIIDQTTGVASTSIPQTRWFTGIQQIEATENSSATIDAETNSRSLPLSSSHGEALYSVAPGWLAVPSLGSGSDEFFYRATDITLVFPSFTTITLTPLRYSNNLIALRRTRDASGINSYTHGPAAFPEGSDPTSSGVSLNAVYGSYNPATGEVVRDKTQPVCWI